METTSKPNEGNQPSSLNWKDLASVAAPFIALSGLVIYGILSLAYDQFYSSLGTTPAEVGLNYSTILAGSVGIFLLMVPLALTFAMFVNLIRHHPPTGLFVTASILGLSLFAATQTGRISLLIVVLGAAAAAIVYEILARRVGLEGSGADLSPAGSAIPLS